MKTVDWLPPTPLRVSAALGYTHHAHIHECAPFLGVNPTPLETVVLLYVGIRKFFLMTAFDPAASVWVNIEDGPVEEFHADYPRIIREAIAFVEAAYPGETFALLREGDPTLN